MNRLPAPYGSRVDRGQRIQFSFEGKAYEGLAGDTIASALAANGQWVLSRSFKYHRPRGILSMAGAEANTLVQLPQEPNVLADIREISEGLQVSAQNVNGSLARDRGATIGWFACFLPVGFYYRTFMGPTKSAWLKLWEPIIRKKAGLGIVDLKAPFRHYSQTYLHCDVLVVGAGPAGLNAAIAAAECGVDVLLADENPELGGSCTFGTNDCHRLIATARSLPNLRIMTGTVCNGWFEDNWVALLQGNVLHRTRAAQVIFATGAIEQPSVFRGNDLPGVMLGSAARRLMQHYAVRPGKRAVVLAANPEGYQTAIDLVAAGVDVAAIIDPRPGGSGADLTSKLGQIPVLRGRVEEAVGKAHLSRVHAARRRIDCDLLIVSIGSAPAWQLPCQAGGVLSYDETKQQFSLAVGTPNVHLAGSVAGHFLHNTVCADGRAAAHRALAELGVEAEAIALPEDLDASTANFDLPLVPHPKGMDFVDFDEDLQIKDLINSIKEGYSELELVKRFSTVGMGPSQGRHSALATARVVAGATKRSVAEIGVTTARPPTGPESLGILSGHAHVPERRTALHAHHVALKAEMKPVGAWWRPYLYGTGDRTSLIHAEVAAVRNGVGVLDVSTLGKLEVRGPEAGAFLDRIYTMAHANQPIGRVRYCLMLNEMGAVVDDGVAYRMAEDRYYATATTGAVARVYADMTFWNAQWGMDVDVVNLTAAFCGLNITGPKARIVMQQLDSDIDFDPGAFPYLEGRCGLVAGIPVRAMRIGFTGELSFELHCAASLASALWEAVMSAGSAHGLRPYGLEASRILRLEKGHVLIGQDTDALTSPDELGFGWAVSRKKRFFVGKRALEMRHRLGQTRALVGLTFPAGAKDVPEESCLVLRNDKPVGQVTSALWSPTLNQTIALAYVHTSDMVKGTPITLRCRNGTEVTSPVIGHAFFDPENQRQSL